MKHLIKSCSSQKQPTQLAVNLFFVVIIIITTIIITTSFMCQGINQALQIRTCS